MGDVRRLREKKVWTEEDGRNAIAAWQASGKTLAGFAKEHGIGDGRLRWWRDRVAIADGIAATAGAGAPHEGPRLVRVELEERAAGRTTRGTWELVTSRGHLRVHEGIGADELRVVLEAVVGKAVVP